MKTEVLVLISGGLDSATCLAYYRDRGFRPEALFIDYGQAARARERAAARAVCAHYEIRLRAIRALEKSEWTGYIPARNAVLLTLALMHHQHREGLIAIGVHAGTGYADCTPGFIRAMQSVFDTYTGGRVRIDAPFVTWHKREIWEYLRHVSPNVIASTYSCERGTAPCGTCASCRDREELNADIS